MKQNSIKVTFSASLYLKIQRLAKKEGKSVSAVVREAVVQELKWHPTPAPKFSDLPTFKCGDETDISQRIDEIVYQL